MNILVIHQYYLEKNQAGGSRFNEMTRMWADQGHKITILAGMVHYATGLKEERYKGKIHFKDEYDTNITVHRCHVSEAYNTNFIGRLWAYFSFVFSSIYVGLFKISSKDVDVIVVTSPPLFVGITAYVLSIFKRSKFLFEIRDLWPESAIDTGVLQNKLIIKMAYAFEKFIYKKATLINVLTPAFRQKLIEEKNIPSEKVIYIPNAADFVLSDELLQNFDSHSFKKNLGLENQFVVTYVGAHGVANHLIQVIETAELTKELPITYLLIGDGMQKPELKKIATEKKLQNIVFIDPVPKKEVFKYILASDAGMSVLKKVDTFKTVFSNKSFDYMACKKPIFMLIDGVSRELVEDAACGVYCEPENPTIFKETLVTYLKDNEKAKIQGENGYQFAKKNFDRSELALKYITELEKIAHV